MKRNKLSKIVALLALLAIVLWVIWTGLLIIFSSSVEPQDNSISIEELQQLVWSWQLSEDSWSEDNK